MPGVSEDSQGGQDDLSGVNQLKSNWRWDQRNKDPDCMERRAPNNQMDKSSQGRLDWKNNKGLGIDVLPEMDSLPLVSTFAKQFLNLESPSRSSPCPPLWFHHILFTYSLLNSIYFPLVFFSPKKHCLFTLLRYNWYIINCTNLKCAIWCHTWHPYEIITKNQDNELITPSPQISLCLFVIS